MFPYAHVRYRLKGEEFAKRPRVRGRRSVNLCDWRKWILSRGGGEGNCEDERPLNTDDAFLSKTDQQPFFPFFQCFSFTRFLPLIDNKCVFSMTHWSHLMLLNISRGRPVSWPKSLPIFSEVCGKLNSGIKFPLSISLQYFHGSQLMGSWFLLLMKGPHHRLV